jgi:hypothetical protein
MPRYATITNKFEYLVLSDRYDALSVGNMNINSNSILTNVSGNLEWTTMNTPNGIVQLDNIGIIPSNLLPSYVDDVLEYSNFASFPVTGEAGKIYIDLSTNNSYRWSGSIYITLSNFSNYYTKTECDTIFRRKDDSYSASQIDGFIFTLNTSINTVNADLLTLSNNLTNNYYNKTTSDSRFGQLATINTWSQENRFNNNIRTNTVYDLNGATLINNASPTEVDFGGRTLQCYNGNIIGVNRVETSQIKCTTLYNDVNTLMTFSTNGIRMNILSTGIVKSDINGNLTSSSVDLSSSDVSSVLPISKGGTNNSSSYTNGSVVFSNGTSLTQDNANLYYNSSSKSLGVGVIPTQLMHMRASAGGQARCVLEQPFNNYTYYTVKYNSHEFNHGIDPLTSTIFWGTVNSAFPLRIVLNNTECARWLSTGELLINATTKQTNTCKLESKGGISIAGNTSGNVNVLVPVVAGSNTNFTLPAATSDLSLTGGTNHVLLQSTVGGAIVSGQLACPNLSDYVTGTYTANLILLNGTGTIPTFANANCRYTKIGNVMHLNISLFNTGGTNGSGSGTMGITLPAGFPPNASSVACIIQCGYYLNNANWTPLACSKGNNGTNSLTLFNGTTLANLPCSVFNNATRRLNLSLFYEL